MKRLKLKCFILCAILLVLTCATSFSATIDWQTYKKGVELAKIEGKPIFLHFWAKWCPYCKEMKNTTFKNTKVIELLNRYFIPIKVNSDSEKKTAAAYRVRGLPMTWFLDKNKKPISSLPGYVKSKNLINVLKYIQSDSYLNISFRKFVKSL